MPQNSQAHVRVLSDAFERLMRLGRRAKSRLGHPDGIDVNGLMLVSHLLTHGATRATDLAEATALDPAVVTRSCKTLVANGYVERIADSDDGRAIRLAATARGSELLESTRNTKALFFQTVLQHWTEADITALAGLLQRAADDMEKHLHSGATAHQHQEKK